jgi:hypothetical protein
VNLQLASPPVWALTLVLGMSSPGSVLQAPALPPTGELSCAPGLASSLYL